MSVLLIFFLGLAVGSFLTCLTYRWPRGLTVRSGRSFCPNCNKKIAWYDNIPLLSFILLKGRCRNCNKNISKRYPFIELFTAFLFVTFFTLLTNCSAFPISQGEALRNLPLALCVWRSFLGWWALPYFLLIVSILVAIFVIDFEHQIIPDNMVFFLLLLGFVAYTLGDNPNIFTSLLSGFAGATFFLFLHLATKGKGMGLGDVKLAIPLGLILGWPYTLVALFLSFIIGGAVGLVLIFLGRAKFGKHIPFGPFLVGGFFITLFWGGFLRSILFPFL